MKTLQYIILFFSISFSVFSQEGCDRLYDSIETDGSLVISSQEVYTGNHAVISKITTLGEELWNIEASEGFYNISLYLFSDSYVYALLRGDTSKILKIDAETGDILWESGIYNEYISKLIDYNSEQIFFYSLSSNGSGSSSGFKVFLINKSDSVLTLSYETSDPVPSPFVLNVDSKGNLYFSGGKYHRSSDSNKISIVKVSGINIHNTLWEESYIQTSTADPSLDELRYIIIDKLDNIYAFNGEDDVDLFKINSNTGEEIWSTNNLLYNTFVSDYKFLNNELYVSHKHRYVGGGTDNFNISKINTETGEIIWTTYESMTIIGAPTSSSGGHEATLSFDFDCNGDVFATGYYGSSNYAPGAWGIMKIDGQDGTKISDITITEDIDFIDHSSVGMFSYFINDELVFLGNIQDETDNGSKFLVKTDSNLAVTYQYGFGCALLSTEEFIVTDYKINVYPNPTNDFLNLQVPNNQNIQSLSLYSIDGSKLKQWKQNLSVISIKDISSGVYFLKITLEDHSSVTKKIIKH